MTSNLADFPADALAAYDLEARHPDDFVLGLIDEHPGTVAEVVRRQAGALRSPPRSVREVFDTLENCDLPQTVAALKEFLEP